MSVDPGMADCVIVGVSNDSWAVSALWMAGLTRAAVCSWHLGALLDLEPGALEPGTIVGRGLKMRSWFRAPVRLGLRTAGYFLCVGATLAGATDAEIRAGSAITTVSLQGLREAETRKLELGGERLDITRQDGRIRFTYLGPAGAPLEKPEVTAGLPADDPQLKCIVLVGERAISAFTLAAGARWDGPVTSLTVKKDAPGCAETPLTECGSGLLLHEPRTLDPGPASKSPARQPSTAPAAESMPRLSVQCFPR